MRKQEKSQKCPGLGLFSMDHNLVLTLDKWGNQIAGNKFTVQSELIDAKDNSYLSAVLSSQKEVSIAAGAGFRW